MDIEFFGQRWSFERLTDYGCSVSLNHIGEKRKDYYFIQDFRKYYTATLSLYQHTCFMCSVDSWILHIPRTHESTCFHYKPTPVGSYTDTLNEDQRLDLKQSFLHFRYFTRVYSSNKPSVCKYLSSFISRVSESWGSLTTQ